MLVSQVALGNEWSYHKSKDQFTDVSESYAFGYRRDYKYNNDYQITFVCKNGFVRFDIDVDTLINTKSKPFKFTYRVDDKETKTITMITFSNSNTGGYTSDSKKIALDILGGANIRVRTVTYNNDYLEAEISLSGSDRAIKKVFSDCGIDLVSDGGNDDHGLTFIEFKKRFDKLNSAQKKELLKKIEQLLENFK
tara:strand:+ start:1011 stop:1592 length:582 start_codon:yes stop_codon:yes gene_type:complete